MKHIIMRFCPGFLLMIIACTHVPLARTLPEYVNSVYVPMAVNNSYEPGLEEKLTNFTIDEFLADGRLRVEEKSNADITVKISIEQFIAETLNTDADDFPMTSRLKVLADVVVFNNLDGKELGRFPDIEAAYIFVSDPRRTVEVTEPEAKENVLRNLASLIVLNVLTGPYAPK